MEDNNKIEKVYELIEQYEFAQLSDTEKRYVLSIMSECEYMQMRQTIAQVKSLFEYDIEPINNIPDNLYQNRGGVSNLKRLVNYPVKLYQVAASIAIILATFILYQYSGKGNESQMLVNNDTVFIRHVDTVYTKIYDTIRVIYKKAEYAPSYMARVEKSNLPIQSTSKIDCKKELCPNEVEDITMMNGKNSISTDSTIRGIMLSLN